MKVAIKKKPEASGCRERSCSRCLTAFAKFDTCRRKRRSWCAWACTWSRLARCGRLAWNMRRRFSARPFQGLLRARFPPSVELVVCIIHGRRTCDKGFGYSLFGTRVIAKTDYPVNVLITCRTKRVPSAKDRAPKGLGAAGKTKPFRCGECVALRVRLFDNEAESTRHRCGCGCIDANERTAHGTRRCLEEIRRRRS